MKTTIVEPAQGLTLMIEPDCDSAAVGLDRFKSLIHEDREEIERQLLTHDAFLFRGFGAFAGEQLAAHEARQRRLSLDRIPTGGEFFSRRQHARRARPGALSRGAQDPGRDEWPDRSGRLAIGELP